MARLLDEIVEDTPGSSLVIGRRYLPVRLDKFRELFAPFSLSGSPWSQLRFERNPSRLMLLSSPSGRKRVEIEWSSQHQLRWHIGEEFGGCIPMQLEVTQGGSQLAQFSLQLKDLTLHEHCKDLAFRAANILGLSSYRAEIDNAQLLLSFTADTVTEETAYRQASMVYSSVPVLRRKARYHERAPIDANARTSRAFDDSYWVASWSAGSYIKLYASTSIRWDEPRERWQESELIGSTFDLTKRLFLYQNADNAFEIPLANLSSLTLSRSANGSKHSAALLLSHGERSQVMLAQSDAHSTPEDAMRALFSLAHALSAELNIPCDTALFSVDELVPSVELKVIATSPALIIAGTDGDRAIAYERADEVLARFVADDRGFTAASNRAPLWFTSSSGNLFEHQYPFWRETKTTETGALSAIAQSPRGDMLAVGERSRVLRKSTSGDWERLPSYKLPSEAQSANFVGVVPYGETGFLLGASFGALFYCEHPNAPWETLTNIQSELCALCSTEDRAWVATKDGRLFSSRGSFSFQQATLPSNKPILSVCSGIARSIFAVGAQGALYQALDGVNFAELQTSRYELLCAKLPQKMPTLTRGHWSQLDPSWRKISAPPLVDWCSAAFDGGYLYVVGGPSVLRAKI